MTNLPDTLINYEPYIHHKAVMFQGIPNAEGAKRSKHNHAINAYHKLTRLRTDEALAYFLLKAVDLAPLKTTAKLFPSQAEWMELWGNKSSWRLKKADKLPDFSNLPPFVETLVLSDGGIEEYHFTTSIDESFFKD